MYRSLSIITMTLLLGLSVAAAFAAPPSVGDTAQVGVASTSMDLTWVVNPDEDVEGDLSNTHANVAGPPFTTSTTQSRTLSGATTSGYHIWGVPDMSNAPGANKGWRLMMQWGGSGGTGTLMSVSILDGDDGNAVISEHPEHLNVLSTSAGSRPTYVYHFPDEDFDGADLSNLRIRLDFERAGGNNQVVTVSGVLFSKSPIETVDEFTGFGDLDGAAVAGFRMQDLLDLGGVDEEALWVWPDATGRGQHLVHVFGNAPTIRVSGGESWVETDGATRLSFILDEPVTTGFARMLDFWLDDNQVHSTPVRMSHAGEMRLRWAGTTPPLVPATGTGLVDKHLLAFQNSPYVTTIMHASTGSVGAHTLGSTALTTETWHQHTGWVPPDTSDVPLGWIGDAEDPENVGSFDGFDVNRLERVSILNRESNDRPMIGRIRESYFFDMDGLTIADLDDARAEWVNGVP